MKRYSMRDILALSSEELWALPKERHVIVCDDGEITTHTHATIVSAYFYIPLKSFPEVPTSTAFHIGDDQFSGKLVLDRINKAIWHIYDCLEETPDPEKLAHLAMRAVNDLTNDASRYAGAYIATLSAFDLHELYYHPKVREANLKAEPTHHSLEKVVYPALMDVLKDPHELRGNPLKESSLAGTNKVGQMLQIIGPLGYKTDIGSQIFMYPIMENLADGNNTAYGALTESRDGTKSLIFNQNLLKDTEYFNRRVQLVAQYLQRLHRKSDCGTNITIEVPIEAKTLEHYAGKYYLKDNGTMDWLRGDEKHLIGRTIQIRSIFGCTHPDPAGVCGVCYGRIALNVPYNTNVGQVSAVEFCDKITSSVLGTKHLVASSQVEKYHLPKKESQFLEYGEVPETLYLKKRIRGRKITMVVHRKEANNLGNILMLPTLDEYPLGKASELTQVLLKVDTGNDGMEAEVLRVSLYNRLSSLSRELLTYLREYKWEHDEYENIVIDLEHFDHDAPLLTLPNKHVNSYDVYLKIKSFLQSGSEGSNKKLSGYQATPTKQLNFLSNYTSVTPALQAFMNMANAKQDNNVVHCEVLLYAMMIRNKDASDYRLPIPGTSGHFETYGNIMANRSMSSLMAYEMQEKPFNTAATFNNPTPPDHPYDLLLLGGKTST